jgi:hypothetical protein
MGPNRKPKRQPIESKEVLRRRVEQLEAELARVIRRESRTRARLEEVEGRLGQIEVHMRHHGMRVYNALPREAA